jgi:hypothetical protein
LGEDYDPVDAEENEDDPIRETQATIALRIQGQFEQRVLRRTAESKNCLGEKLIKLPKLQEYTALITLQQFERDIHLAITERMRDEYVSFSLRHLRRYLSFQTFFLQHDESIFKLLLPSEPDGCDVSPSLVDGQNSSV